MTKKKAPAKKVAAVRKSGPLRKKPVKRVTKPRAPRAEKAMKYSVGELTNKNEYKFIADFSTLELAAEYAKAKAERTGRPYVVKY